MRKYILAAMVGLVGLGGFSAVASACERDGVVTTYQPAPYAYRYAEPVRARNERFERERFEHGRFERGHEGRRFERNWR